MFFEFGIKDIIDIFLVALMLYYIYRLMKESSSLNVFIGILMFVVLWLFVSQILEMRLLGSIMDKLVSVGVIGLIVLFQEDIRKFLYNLGAHQRMRMLMKILSSGKDKKGEHDKESIVPIEAERSSKSLSDSISATSSGSPSARMSFIRSDSFAISFLRSEAAAFLVNVMTARVSP